MILLYHFAVVKCLFIYCSTIKFTGWQDVPNGNVNAPIHEGMNGAEVERRLSQPVSSSVFESLYLFFVLC